MTSFCSYSNNYFFFKCVLKSKLFTPKVLYFQNSVTLYLHYSAVSSPMSYMTLSGQLAWSLPLVKSPVSRSARTGPGWWGPPTSTSWGWGPRSAGCSLPWRLTAGWWGRPTRLLRTASCQDMVRNRIHNSRMTIKFIWPGTTSFTA